jgi:serine/threonine protein kinase
LLPDSFVKILNVFKVENQRIVVYEYAEGMTLLEEVLIQKDEKLPVEKVQKIAYQLLKALSYLHNKGIYHGHLTPNSLIMVDSEKSMVKMTGFGYHPLL